MKDEIQKLLAEGIIEPSVSLWRTQVVVTKSEIHKRRMVIDYSLTVNRFTLLDAYPLPRIDDQINEIVQHKYFSTLDLTSAYYQIPLAIEDRPFTVFEANGKLYQYCHLPFGVTNGVSAFQRIMDGIIEHHKLKGTFAYLDNITIGGHSQQEHDKFLSAFLEVAKNLHLTFNESKSIISVDEVYVLNCCVSHKCIKPDPERLKPLIDLPAPKNRRILQRVVGMFAYYAKWLPNFSEKIRPLMRATIFPLPNDVAATFKHLKQDLSKACLGSIDENAPFTIECDASNFAVAAA